MAHSGTDFTDLSNDDEESTQVPIVLERSPSDITAELSRSPSVRKELEDIEIYVNKSPYEQCADDIVDDAIKVMSELGDFIPQNTLWAGSFYSIVIPFLLEEVKIAFSLPQPALLGPVWNYIDCLFTVFLSTDQMLNAKNHFRPNAQAMKGVLNLLSGIQLTTLTTLGFFVGAAAAWSGFGFAAAGAACFVISMDETVRTYRRLQDEEYWMKDSLAQLLKMEELEIKLNRELEQLDAIKQNLPPEEVTKAEWSEWAIQKKVKRLRDLQGNIRELRLDIEVRAKMMMIDGNDNIDTLLGDYNTNRNQDSSPFLINHDIDYKLTEEEERRKLRIEKDCKDQYHSSRKDSAMLFLAFAGMLFMCFPPTHIAGVACVAVAAGYLLKKNAPKITAGIKSLFTFFCCPTEEKEKKSEVQNLNKSDEELADEVRDLRAMIHAF